MTEYLLHLGTIPWWFYIVSLTLVSTFLHQKAAKVLLTIPKRYKQFRRFT